MEANIKHGESLFAEGKIEEAEKCFLDLLDNDATNAEILNNLGVICHDRGNIEEAEDYFLKAFAVKNNHLDTLLNLVDLYQETKRWEDAATQLEKCININTQETNLYNQLGMVYLETGDSEKARQALAKSLELNPDQDIVKESLITLERKETDSSSFSLSLKQKEKEDLMERNSKLKIYPPIPDKIDDDLLFSQTNPQDVKDLTGLKILHCPFEIAGQLANITQHLKKLNLKATSANYYDTWLHFQCDINLHINSLPKEEAIRKINIFARNAIEEFDIFHFHFSRSLYPDFRDLNILKEKEKIIIFSFWGIDMRSPEWYFYNQAKFLGYSPPKPYFLSRQLYQVHKLINRYADVMLGSICLPRGLFVQGMADLAEWSPEEKHRVQRVKGIVKDEDKTYFLHAPTNNWKKGSHMILKLLEECKAEGMPIELLYVSGVPPNTTKEIFVKADFAIDMVGHGSFGTFGLEMMGWEIPVLVYQDALWDRIRNYPPVIKITKQSFKEKIWECIELKRNGKIAEFAANSRAWAISQAEFRVTGIPEYVRIYAELARGNRVQQYVNPAWYHQEYLMESGFKSEFYKYMNENKVFSEIGIKVSDYDKRLYV